MIKLSKYTPNPLAPSYMVDRLGGFFLVGSRFIRCVYTTDNVERVNLIWDNTVVHGESDIYRSIIEEIRRGTFRSDGWHGVQ